MYIHNIEMAQMFDFLCTGSKVPPLVVSQYYDCWADGSGTQQARASAVTVFA